MTLCYEMHSSVGTMKLLFMGAVVRSKITAD